MKKVTCFYYCTGANRFPVKDFINSLDFNTRKKFFFAMSLLEEFGHDLPLPHADYIGGKIFELRFRGAEGHIRVLYFFFHQNRAIFTNGFVKKSNRIPKRQKKIAIERRRTFLENKR